MMFKFTSFFFILTTFCAAFGATETATFAGGCFWCMEPPYDKVKGVTETKVGYTGGSVENPSYAQVSAGETGHAEAVEVTYDPSIVSYAELLQVFWRNIDPMAKDRQFCDQGSQYRSAIFYHDDEQKKLAEASKQRLLDEGIQPIYTQIVPADHFWLAEAYHQNYYKTHPFRYKFYRYRCGRDKRLQEIWGK